MSAPAPPPPHQIEFAPRLSAPAAFSFAFLPVVAGLGAAAVIHFSVVLPRLGVGSSDLNRMVALGHHLESPAPAGTRTAFAVGDSVTVEGIDADIVKANAPPGWTIENIGINGCDRAEVKVILPKIMAAKPAAVIFVLRPLSITEPPPIAVDGAYAYALGGFPKLWPPAWVEPDSPGVPPNIFRDLTASETLARIHFRSALSYVINDGLRERVRKGIKFARPDNWVAPFNMTSSISGPELTRHLTALENEVRESTAVPPTGHEGTPNPASPTATHEAEMERLIRYTRDHGSIPVLFAAPVHPRMASAPAYSAVAARLKVVARDWATETGGVFADASALLDETGFADGQHLNAHGRQLLSEFVGKHLPAS